MQHPSLYSPAGLEYSLQLLVDFVEGEVSPEQAREQRGDEVDSSQRKWRIKGIPGTQGAYKYPVRWSLTARDVVTAGADRYIDRVAAWARAILADLRLSGNRIEAGWHRQGFLKIHRRVIARRSLPKQSLVPPGEETASSGKTPAEERRG